MSDEQEKFSLMLLRENPEHTYEMTTHNNCIVPINIKAIQNLTAVPDNQRAPNFSECAKLMSTIFTQKCDPYQEECWLVPQWAGGFHYTVMVAAQVRMRKALAQPDYNGYVWGFITTDGTRHEPGRASKANPDELTGVWGEVYRKGIEHPYYHETFIKDFKKESKSKKGSWDIRETTMILKVNRDQTHKFAYAHKMGNLCTDNELNAYGDDEIPFDEPVCGTPSRTERRRVVVSKPTEQEPPQEVVATVTEPPSVDTDGITDEDAGGEVMRWEELFLAVGKAMGLDQNEAPTLEKVQQVAAYYLAEEIEDIEDGMSPFQIERVIRDVEANGIPESCK